MSLLWVIREIGEHNNKFYYKGRPFSDSGIDND